MGDGAAASTRWLVGIAGSLMLLFGLLCLNYTMMDNYERHSQFAQERGLPLPSRGIACLCMLFASLGGGMLGFTLCRRPPVTPPPSQ